MIQIPNQEPQEDPESEELTPEELAALEPEARKERCRTIAHLINAEKKLIAKYATQLRAEASRIEEQAEEAEVVLTCMEQALDGILDSLDEQDAGEIEAELTDNTAP